jgi:hypothetical protein
MMRDLVSAKDPDGSKRSGHTVENTERATPVLWREPADIESRDLFFGPGGREHAPRGRTFIFIKEDLAGTNPKFLVRDDDGVQWKIKLGAEAKPETAASRLVWAVGYLTDEDYYMPDVRIEGLPEHLHRGKQFISADGSVRGVRLKREDKSESKKAGMWKWKCDPFTNTRELNALRALMAVINNWDLKDSNNAIRVEKPSDATRNRERVYMVSDLGASFGTVNLAWPHENSKGNLEAYSRSRYITKTTATDVAFAVPGRPSIRDVVNPREYFARLRMRWIGRHVPRSDVMWMGQMLARLSPNQIRDAFRAAGYSEVEVEGFARVVENRIAVLNDL